MQKNDKINIYVIINLRKEVVYVSEEQILELFHKPFDLSAEIDDTFVKIWKNENLKQAIEYLKSVGATTLDIKSYEVLYKLNECTKKKTTKEEQQRLIASLVDNKEVLSAKIEYNETKKTDEIQIETIDGPIRLVIFSNLAEEILEDLPELETDKRAGECYRLAYEINRHLGLPHEIVTGYIYGYTDISRFLHSWIELTYKGEEYVLDGTLNALINKSAYYRLRKSEPITRISDDTFQNDLENHMDIINGVNIEVYFLYRNELINGEPLSPDKFIIESGTSLK